MRSNDHLDKLNSISDTIMQILTLSYAQYGVWCIYIKGFGVILSLVEHSSFKMSIVQGYMDPQDLEI